MAINSVSNIVILIIQVLSLISVCYYPFGIFCSTISTIRRYAVVQYFNIVFVETVSAFFHLISNFTYVAFSINRIYLVGKNEGFFTFFSKLSILKYMTFSIIISILLSLVKGFRFQLNTMLPTESFPMIFYRNIFVLATYKKTIYCLLFVFDAIYDLSNYIIFNIINLTFDLILLCKIRSTLEEKKNKQAKNLAFNPELIEKKTNEINEVIQNVTRMIILNACINFVCKLPSSISLNDLRLLIATPFSQTEFERGQNLFKFLYMMSSFCFVDLACLVFQSFGNFLFMISLSLGFFFYYSFDKKFKSACNLTLVLETRQN